MRKLLIATVATSMFVSAGVASAQNGQGRNPQGVEQFTVGDCISDGFLGNEPNIEGPFAPGGPSEQEPGTKGGRVVPSQSPGPFFGGPADTPRNDRTRFTSPGEINQMFGGGSLQEFCRALAEAED